MLWKRNIKLPVLCYNYNLTIQVVSIRKITLMEWGVLGGLLTSPEASLDELGQELGIPQLEFLEVVHNQLSVLGLITEENQVEERGKDLFEQELMESDPVVDDLEIQYLPDAQQWLINKQLQHSIKSSRNRRIIEDPEWLISSKGLNTILKEHNSKEWKDKGVNEIWIEKCEQTEIDMLFTMNIVNYPPFITVEILDTLRTVIDVPIFNRFYQKNNQNIIDNEIYHIANEINSKQYRGTSRSIDSLAEFLEKIEKLVDIGSVKKELVKRSNLAMILENFSHELNLDKEQLCIFSVMKDYVKIENKYTRNWNGVFEDCMCEVELAQASTHESVHILQQNTWIGFEFFSFQYNEVKINLIGQLQRTNENPIHNKILQASEALPELKRNLIFWFVNPTKRNEIASRIIRDLCQKVDKFELLADWKRYEPEKHGITLTVLLKYFTKETIIQELSQFKSLVSNEELLSIVLESETQNLKDKFTVVNLEKVVKLTQKTLEIDEPEAIGKLHGIFEVRALISDFTEASRDNQALSAEFLEEVIGFEKYLGASYTDYLNTLGNTLLVSDFSGLKLLHVNFLALLEKHSVSTSYLKRVVDLIFPALEPGWFYNLPPNLDPAHEFKSELDTNLLRKLENQISYRTSKKAFGEWKNWKERKLVEQYQLFSNLISLHKGANKIIITDLLQVYPECNSKEETIIWLDLLSNFNMKDPMSKEVLHKCHFVSLSLKEIQDRLESLNINEHQIKQHTSRKNVKVKPQNESVVSQDKQTLYVDGPNIARDQLKKNSRPEVNRFEILRLQLEKDYNLNVLIVVSAKFWRDVSAKQRANLEDLQENNRLMTAPAFRADDHFAIQSARKNNGFILSNDAYRDWVEKDPSLQEWLETYRITCAWNLIEKNFTIGPNIKNVQRRKKS